MVCKKCKKECLESELKDGVCIECDSKRRNNTITIIVISVFISTILNLGITIWANNDVKLSDFKVETFNLETDTTSYSTTYQGKGTISCSDKNNDYLVLIEEVDLASEKTEYNYTVIHKGVGEFGTYDSSYTGTNKKPEYKFNIIGYRSFKK